MNLRRTLIILLAIAISAFAFSKTALAQDVSTAFQENSNPHAICKYYRDNGYKVERESDNECLISMGEGQFITYTQYYYSGSNWCYKMTQEGKNYAENCIPIPGNNFDIEEYIPYIVGGVVLLVVISAGASSANMKSKIAKQNSSPEVVETSETATDDQKAKDTKQLHAIRSGRSSYGWEEMETTTTDTGEDMTKGPSEGQSQGGMGLHQGEPIVHSVASELDKLVKLRQKGVISQKEFNLAKKKLLK